MANTETQVKLYEPHQELFDTLKDEIGRPYIDVTMRSYSDGKS